MSDKANSDPTPEPIGAEPSARLDDSAVSAVYANFCRISGTPEELVLDFALNSSSAGKMPEELKLNQRVIINFYTAKRLLGALHMAVQRHEAAFGALELDMGRRLAAERGKSK